jgi:hypothetical protein
MKSTARTRAHYAEPDVPEERANRLWEGIVRGGARRARRRMRTVALAAGLVAAALALFVLVRPSRSQRAPLPLAPAPSLAGRVFDGEDRSQQLVLPDGSTVVIEAATRLVIVEATEASVRLRLDRGRITCDVTPRPERPFVVLAGDNEVRVKGTRFSVGAHEADDAGASLEVHVERGVVEVGDGRGARVAELRAGETWMKDPPGEARNAADPWPQSAATPPPAHPAPPETAQMLFRRADATHAAGQIEEAAALFDQLRRRFPSDSHAGLAAFEAGRLRLDSLNDPRGAADSFAFAMGHTEGAFREDAEANRVEALARVGDLTACRAARDAFVKHYPDRPRTASISARCP